jgi:hypothetical protein
VSNSSPQPQLPKITFESDAVQNYLNILQGVIARMASNSANCKTWCITLSSAILVVIADKNKPNYAWIALIPIILFFLLDAYYLAQERSFRAIYNKFIQDLHSGKATTENLFVLVPLRGFDVVQSLFEASSSFAVYPFYLMLVVTMIIARVLIL